MPQTSIGVQLYTLRDFLKTPADIAQTLQRVRKIGYEAVQVSGLGKIDPKELATILRNEGLTCAATHVPLDRMKSEPQALLDEHALWNCRYTAIGGFFPKEATTQTWIDFATAYNPVAEKLAAGGLKVGYHNHSHELAHFDGKPALRILLEHFHSSVWMELDTYWIQHGGGDPCAWIREVKGKIPCIHLKDMAIQLDRTQLMAEVGEGNLNWTGILAACREAGVEWYLVEQDTCQRDPFESIEISLKNLKEMGLA